MSISVEPGMTTTVNKGFDFTVHNRTDFYLYFELSKTLKLRQWFFQDCQFTKNDVELI